MNNYLEMENEKLRNLINESINSNEIFDFIIKRANRSYQDMFEIVNKLELRLRNAVSKEKDVL